MADKSNSGDKDLKTGREAKDPQMKAMKGAMGTPVRQAELPPFVGKDKMPGEQD